MEKIAVIVDKAGKASSFFEGSSIAIYDKTEDGWKCYKTIELNLSQIKGMQALRQGIADIIQQVDSCKIVVGSEISGLPYNILDAADISIFELKGLPSSFLDVIPYIIKEDIKKHRDDEEAFRKLTTPKPTGAEGRYKLNLTDIQKDHSQISSKQILAPIFKEQSFNELEVICDHVPPWFERELGNYGLEHVTEQECEYIYKVTIRHKSTAEEARERELKCR